MCDAISHATKWLGNNFEQIGSCAHNMFSDSIDYLGKKIEIFRHKTAPELAKAITEIALDTLKNLFWLVPYVALTVGHYGDAAISSIVALASLLDISLQDREVREAAAVVIGAPLAINVAIRAIRLLATGDSFYAVSLLFHLVCLAKLALIAKGQNYNS